MRRLLLWRGVPLLALIIAGAGLFWFGAATERGLRWLLPKIVVHLPGTFSYESVRGRLVGPLTFEGIRYSNGPTTVTLKRLSLDWIPYFLLSGELYINELRAQGLVIERRQPSQPFGRPFSLPQVNLPPFVVSIKAATVEDIVSLRGKGLQPLVIDRIAFSMSTGLNTVFIRNLAVEAPAFRVTAKGRVRPRGDYPLSVEVGWTLRPEAGPEIEGSGPVGGSLERLSFEQRLSRPAIAHVAGTVDDPFSGLRWNVKAEVLDFDPQRINGEWPSLSVRGSVASAGAPDNYTYETALDLSGKNIPKGRWTARGSGSRDAVEIASLTGSLLGGEVSAQGRARWKPSLSWQLTASGRGLNPGELLPEWQGKISLEAAAEGGGQDNGAESVLEMRQVRGVLRGFPFSASMRVMKSGDTYRLAWLRVSSGEASASAWGTVSATWNLDGKFAASDLNALFPALGGALRGNGSLEGPRRTPLISFDLSGHNVKYENYRAGVLRAEGSVDLSDKVDSRIKLRAGEVRVGEQSLKAVALNGSGRLSAHTITATLDTGGLSIPLALRGGYSRGVWKGSVEQAQAVSKDYGVWTLERPGPLTVNAATGAVRGGWWCLEGANNAASRLCFRAERDEALGIQGEGAVRNLPLAFLKPLLPPALSVAGVFSGSAEASYKGNILTARLELATPEGTLSYPLTPKESATLAYASLSLSAALTEKALTARLSLPLSEGGSIKAAVTLPSFSLFGISWAGQELQGTVAAEVPRIGIVSALVPSLRNVQGTLTANLSLSGTVAAPRIAGRAAIENGSATLPDLGIRLAGVSLSLTGAEGGRARITGSAESGPGSLTLSGTAALSAGQGWPLSLRITGQNFEALRRPDARVLVSPDLTLGVKGRTVDVSGEVLIPRATLQPRAGSGGVPVSEDVVIITRGEQKDGQQKEERWRITSRVRIVLGEEVRFSGFGLTASATGSVLVVDGPGQPTTARGELRIVNGRYEAYRQTLRIDGGRLVYAGGPIGNPALDMRAVRKVEEVTAGVLVQGTLRNPRLTLFSDPDMEQTQILSYLVLGRPLQGASAEQGRILYQAAQSLTLGGGEFLAQRIGQLFGLKDVRVETGSTLEEASLVLGAYLSPRLYVSYGIGLFEPAGRLQVRYDLSRRLQLRVESGIESGADLLYKFER